MIKDGEKEKEADDGKEEGESLSLHTSETDGANHQPLFISSRTCQSCSANAKTANVIEENESTRDIIVKHIANIL